MNGGCGAVEGVGAGEGGGDVPEGYQGVAAACCQVGSRRGVGDGVSGGGVGWEGVEEGLFLFCILAFVFFFLFLFFSFTFFPLGGEGKGEGGKRRKRGIRTYQTRPIKNLNRAFGRRGKEFPSRITKRTLIRLSGA